MDEVHDQNSGKYLEIRDPWISVRQAVDALSRNFPHIFSNDLEADLRGAIADGKVRSIFNHMIIRRDDAGLLDVDLGRANWSPPRELLSRIDWGSSPNFSQPVIQFTARGADGVITRFSGTGMSVVDIDVVRLIEAAIKVAEVQPGRDQDAGLKAIIPDRLDRGRMRTDAPILHEMAEAIRSGSALSVNAAATRFIDQAPPPRVSPDSTISRLSRNFRLIYGENGLPLDQI